jgi:fructoselysine-6-P-deglycase FrlB-like protein
MLDALSGRVPTLAISALAASPVAERASRSIILDFADEKSVVQTRFATTTLALFRAHLGDDVEQAARDAQRTLDSPLPVDAASFQHFVFLGTSWTVGLAGEAALKMRETSGAWAESYPAMEYRHGPISVASATTLVWALGDMPSDLLDDVRATGATVVGDIGDPMAELVMVQRAAAARARALGRDPDRPVHLSRSVILG